MSESLYPPLTPAEVNDVGESHSEFRKRAGDERDMCYVCNQPFPCLLLRFATEWYQHRIAEQHAELLRLREDGRE